MNYPVRDDESILTLAYIFDHAVCCASAASSGRSLHLITSQLRTKQSLDCPNHVRQTKSSVKKRIIVCRSVRSMFGEQTFAKLRTGFKLVKLDQGPVICLRLTEYTVEGCRVVLWDKRVVGRDSENGNFL